MASGHALVCPLGRVAYQTAWALQKKIKDRLIEARCTEELLPHIVLLLEHPPVYTLGRSGDASHLLLEESALSAFGAEFYRTDRGGDITFHGPGQLVGYFLLDLDRIFRDLHRYMRSLEEVVLCTLADYGIDGSRVAGRTGVWVGDPGSERKVCALGIRSSRWVTMHGIAFNMNTNLSFYRYIVPCGIADRNVTSLGQELGHRVDESDVRRRVTIHFGKVFNLNTTLLTQEAAYGHLESMIGMQGLQDMLQAPASRSCLREPLHRSEAKD